MDEQAVQVLEAAPSETEPVEETPPEPPTPEQLQTRVTELEGLVSTHEEAVKQAKTEAEAAKTKWEAHFQSVADTKVREAKMEAGDLVRRELLFERMAHLYDKATQQSDTEATEEYNRLIATPDGSRAWQWGIQQSEPPDIKAAAAQAKLDQLNEIQAALEKSPIIGKLGADKMLEIRQATPRNERMPGYLLRLAEAAAEQIAEEKAQKLYEDKMGEHAEAVKNEVLGEEHAKAGGVAELKGAGTMSGDPAKLRRLYADGEIDTATYEGRMKAAGAKP